MYLFYLVFLIPVGAFFYNMYSLKKREKAKKQRFSSSFGKTKYAVSSAPKEVSPYWHHVKRKLSSKTYVDETTWNDLSMDDVFMAINNCQTSPGEDVLFASLHQNQKQNDQQQKDFEAWQSYLNENPQVRLQLQMHFDGLGKSPSTPLIDLFEYPENFTPYKKELISILGYIPLLTLPLAFISPLAAMLFFLVSSLSNAFVFYQFNQKLQNEHPVIAYLSFFLYAANNIFKTLSVSQLPQGEKALDAFSLFKKTSARFSRVSELNVYTNNELVMIVRSIRVLFLRQIIAYNKGVSIVKNHLDSLYFLYQYIGSLDMAISTLAYRKSLPYYCLPRYEKNIVINAQEAYHPLLPSGVPNSLMADKSIILTGSNASGKSTFLKTMALNAIFAHSIHTCCARAFILPDAPVYTSMAISDSIFKGESYFIAEIKSIKRILTAAKQAPCLCFIDEILRGTNTIERIAASTAILEQILDLPCLCMIATHDIELTEIFKGLYDQYHFRETIINNDITFNYILYPGPSKTKNAIELLNLLGFEKSVIQKAKNLAQYFEQNNHWLSLKNEDREDESQALN